jgi:hypothetical protein
MALYEQLRESLKSAFKPKATSNLPNPKDRPITLPNRDIVVLVVNSFPPLTRVAFIDII